MPLCSFCKEPSVSSYLARAGKVPRLWETGSNAEAKDNPDKSKLVVIRVCAAHKEQVPR